MCRSEQNIIHSTYSEEYSNSLFQILLFELGYDPTTRRRIPSFERGVPRDGIERAGFEEIKSWKSESGRGTKKQIGEIGGLVTALEESKHDCLVVSCDHMAGTTTYLFSRKQADSAR